METRNALEQNAGKKSGKPAIRTCQLSGPASYPDLPAIRTCLKPASTLCGDARGIGAVVVRVFHAQVACVRKGPWARPNPGENGGPGLSHGGTVENFAGVTGSGCQTT